MNSIPTLGRICSCGAPAVAFHPYKGNCCAKCQKRAQDEFNAVGEMKFPESWERVRERLNLKRP